MADDITQPPGSLSTMGKLWEGFKHIGKKALKWGAILGGIGLLVGATPFFGWIAEAVVSAPGLSAITSYLKIESAAGIVGTAGAIIGGLFGAAMGASDVVDVVETKEDDRIAGVHREQIRAKQMAMMDMQMAQRQAALAQSQQLGGQALPRGVGQGQGLG